MKLSNVIVSPLKAELVTALQYHFYLHEYPPGTVATTPSGARTPHPVPDFGSSPGAWTIISSSAHVFYTFCSFMFCSLDIFR